MTSKQEQELASYRRVLDRERQARKLAEQQLEDYSRDIYDSNKLLKEQTRQAQLKQNHLAFLFSVAEDNWQTNLVSELIVKYLSKSCRFLESASAAFFQVEKDLTISRLKASGAKEQDTHNPSNNNQAKQSIQSLLNEMDLGRLKEHFVPKNNGELISATDFSKPEGKISKDITLYLLPVFHSKGKEDNKLSCICFYYASYSDVDVMKLQTIEASHSIFSAAIERKKAEAALKKKLVELQNSNEEIQQMQLQLIESEKLASLGQLSAGVAHEINNPVGFVLSNLSSMAGYMNDIEQAISPLSAESSESAEAKLDKFHTLAQQFEVDFLVEDTKAILSSSIAGLQRVKDIVSDLGSFSRMDTDELSLVDINKVIQSALNISKNELKYEHIVETKLEPDLEILGNDGQLQQVFINFFVNAKQAMPDGGHLWITSEKVKERVVVSIKDEGHGIAPEALKEIFTPFYTTKPPGEGTGLGLSISYSILQRHHAKITVNGEVGKGTEFKLSFVSKI